MGSVSKREELPNFVRPRDLSLKIDLGADAWTKNPRALSQNLEKDANFRRF